MYLLLCPLLAFTTKIHSTEYQVPLIGIVGFQISSHQAAYLPEVTIITERCTGLG